MASNPQSPTSTLPDSDLPIILQCGERRFHVRQDTLIGESEYFRRQFKESWSRQSPDGSYFFDIDGDTFEHVLRYLRSGIYPVFYDKNKGHNYSMYSLVHQQADFLVIPKLETWLAKKEYLKVVTVDRAVSIENTLAYGSCSIETTNADVELDVLPRWETRKVYICPRKIARHRDSRNECGQACKKVLGLNEPKYENESILRLATVKKTIRYNGDLAK